MVGIWPGYLFKDTWFFPLVLHPPLRPTSFRKRCQRKLCAFYFPWRNIQSWSWSISCKNLPCHVENNSIFHAPSLSLAMKPTKRQSIIGRRSSVRIHSGPNVSHGHTSGFNHNWRPALLLRQLGGPFGRRDSWKYLKQSLQTYFYIYIWHTYTLYIINYSTYGKRERERDGDEENEHLYSVKTSG